MQRSVYSIEAEQSVIGAALLDDSIVSELREIVTPDDFYSKEYKKTWEVICQLSSEGKPIDIVSVTTELDDRGINAVAFLAQAARNTPSTSNAKEYARAILERARLRDYIRSLSEISNNATHSDLSVDELIDAAQSQLMQMGRNEETTGASLIGDILKTTIDKMDDIYNGKVESNGVSFGLTDLDKMTNGAKPDQLIIIGGRPASGKEQPMSANVLTVNGFKRMGEIQVGDKLASIDGEESIVNGVYPQGVKDVFRIEFSDGRVCEAGKDHLWTVYYRDWEEPRVLTTSKVMDMLTRKRYKRRLWIDMFDGDFSTNEKLPIHPWALGALIANGSISTFTKVYYTSPDDHNVSKLRSLVETDTVKMVFEARYGYRINYGKEKGNIRDCLADLGLMGKKSEHKHIPKEYLNSSRENRLQLLCGLVDNDGWIEKLGTVWYSTSSKQLADDVVYLVRSLGGMCHVSRVIPHYTHKGEYLEGLPHYKISIMMSNYDGVVSLPRKAERLGVRVGKLRKRSTFKSVEFARREECQCIHVSHPSHLYITDDFIVTHNTTVALNVAKLAGIDSKPCILFSLEMSKESMADRILASASEVSLAAIKHPNEHVDYLDETGWMKLSGGINLLSKAPIVIDDRAAISPSMVRTSCLKWKKKLGDLSIIIIDYLQLMTADIRSESREQQISSISRSLKQLSKELGCPVVALSQLSRNLESRQDKRPMMSDLRESGAIEQDADVIMFIYRDEVYNKETEHKGIAEIIVAKQRDGEIGTVYAKADLAKMRITDLGVNKDV